MPEPPQPEPLKNPVVSDVIEIIDDNERIIDVVILSTEDQGKIGIQIKNYIPREPVETLVEEVIPVSAVDEKPKFMGGDENEFTKWVLKNMTYPEEAMKNGIQGRVICSFVVDAKGNVTNVKILRGVDSSLDKEAIRAISKSPRWTPGEQRGKPVRVSYTFPVIFQLR
jgi:protein TonB